MEVMKIRVTMEEIASKAGVSKSTVSRVLNNVGNVNEKTFDKVMQVIKEMDYQPNELARSLRINNTNTIGVVISNILNPFFTSLVRSIEDFANENKYHVIICNTDEKIEKEIEYVRTLINRKVDGLIVATTGNIMNYQELVGETPIVFVDRIPHEEDRKKFDIVLVDNEQASYRVTRYLINKGCANIGIITGDDISTTGYERLIGYKKALRESNLQIKNELIKIGSFLGEDSYTLAKELLSNTSCDAIFATNSLILKGVLDAVKNLNLLEQKNIKLFSFDDEDWYEHSSIKINSIKQPITEIGKKSLELLLNKIERNNNTYDEVRYETELIIRDGA